MPFLSLVKSGLKTTAANLVNKTLQSLNPVELAKEAIALRRAQQVRKQWGVALGSIILAAGAMTLPQILQVVGLAIKLLKTTKGAAGLPSINVAKYVYPSVPKVQVNFPLKWACALLSLLMLGCGSIRSRKIFSWNTPKIPLSRYGGILLLLVVGGDTLAKVSKRCRSPIGAWFATKYIGSTLEAGKVASSLQRQVFGDLPLVSGKPQQAHTHGKSARDRNAGSATAVLAALSLGLEPYLIQQSLADQRKGHDGDRSYHWAKDISIPPADFHLDSSRQAGILVDVDYYIDMPVLLARYPGTYFVSSFQPTAAALDDGEYSFRFLADNRVRYQVSGGASYEHEVWDYSGDTLLVEDIGLFQKSVHAYHLDRKYIDAHHSIIMFSLLGSFTMPTVIPTSWLLEGRQLDRLKPVSGNHAVIDTMTQGGLHRSVAIVGQHTAVTLPKTKFDAVQAVAMIAKVPITQAMVASHIAPSDTNGLPTEKMPPGHAAIVAGYIQTGVGFCPPVVYPPSEALLPVYFSRNDYDAPVPLAAFGSPIIGPCYAYATSIASDDRCVAGRVEKMQSKCDEEQPVPPRLATQIEEFVKRLIRRPGLGHPVDHDEVREKQSRPAQRVIIDRESSSGPVVHEHVAAFVKKESAVKVSDPRNISQMPYKLEYSTWMYAFHEQVMKTQKWYAFRYTPAEISERVVEILADIPHSVMADGSRFDGHVNRRARIFERVCMLRHFAAQYHSQINEAMDAQIALPGTTTEGRRYFTGFSRGSGSLETSDFNSNLTAFIDFCALTETCKNGRRLTFDEAWDALGLYGGDDSLAGAVDPAALKRSSEMMGQDYEIKVVPRGEIGVEFLNRQFGPDVWNGDPSSMANPSRLLSKLWVGPTHLHDPVKRFAERCSGYYRMDRNSPVVGNIVQLAHVYYGEYMEGALMPWDGKHSIETNWPNEDSGWMMDLFLKFIPDFDFDRYHDWLASILAKDDPSLLLRAPLCTSETEPATVKQPCVVGEELMVPEPPKAVAPAEVQPPVVPVVNAQQADFIVPIVIKSPDGQFKKSTRQREQAKKSVYPSRSVQRSNAKNVGARRSGLAKAARRGVGSNPRQGAGKAAPFARSA